MFSEDLLDGLCSGPWNGSRHPGHRSLCPLSYSAPPLRAGDCRPTSPGCKSGLCAQKPSSPGEERIPHHRGPRGPLSPLGSSLLSPRNIKHINERSSCRGVPVSHIHAPPRDPRLETWGAPGCLPAQPPSAGTARGAISLRASGWLCAMRGHAWAGVRQLCMSPHCVGRGSHSMSGTPSPGRRGRLTAASAHLLWQSQATAGFLPLGGFVVMPRPTSPAAQSPGCASHSSGCRWLILDSYGAKCSFWSHWTSRPPGQWPFSAPCEIRSQPGSPCI